MKKTMRAFGIGVFLAGATLAGYNELFPNEQAKNTKALEKQIKQYEQQIEQLTKQLDKQDTKKEAAVADNVKATESHNDISNTSTEKGKDSDEVTQSSEDVVQATIYVYENVSIYTIGQQAEDLGIVQNGRELELFLAKPEYSRSIQKGAFDLRSDMTIEEIAKTLTGKN